MAKMALGSGREFAQPDCIRALVMEFIVTFLFVFAGVGSAMATEKLKGDSLDSLFFVAMAHALVVAVMVSAALQISGGHLNPAVTLGLCVGGHITVVRSVLYFIDQCLASTVACILLKFLTGGRATPVHTLASGVGCLQGVMLEFILTFSLLFAVYANIVSAQKSAHIDGLGPLITGLVVGANVMAGGAFSGASMNPARSFGPALVSWDWTNHWVYWVGPLVGGAVAGFVYENFFINRPHLRLPTRDEEEEEGF
ncbi:aquaporin TIP4-1 [Vitis riparia]|uniref:aquaporin TIP4-1 n=1 Tax=Vitis riparia TaxID=96939 RepID=UPI00155ADEE0|nr:aquaporin TIP4-1 [Vitis riparia]